MGSLGDWRSGRGSRARGPSQCLTPSISFARAWMPQRAQGSPSSFLDCRAPRESLNALQATRDRPNHKLPSKKSQSPSRSKCQTARQRRLRSAHGHVQCTSPSITTRTPRRFHLPHPRFSNCSCCPQPPWWWRCLSPVSPSAPTSVPGALEIPIWGFGEA